MEACEIEKNFQNLPYNNGVMLRWTNVHTGKEIIIGSTGTGAAGNYTPCRSKKKKTTPAVPVNPYTQINHREHMKNLSRMHNFKGR
jgi:hypothetical protein